VYGKSAAGEIYEGIIDAIPDLRLESVSRFASGDHVVDESVATGHIEGTFIGIEGGGAPVRFRILHVFDIRDGLISREQAWFDTAGVIRQVEAHRQEAPETK
jgi:predicted ester cyclase